MTQQKSSPIARAVAGQAAKREPIGRQVRPGERLGQPLYSPLRNWMAKEGSAYAFLSMYALLFTTFIVIPVLLAVGLSFTFFDTIQAPTDTRSRASPATTA